MSGNPLRWGLLSTAAINQRILAAAAASERATVVAVASRDCERAAAYAAAHGIDGHHGSYEELLADPDVDAVYVPLPNHLHHEWTMRALDAGKHVLCEKPYAVDPACVEAAFDRSERAGLILSEGFMYRYNPQIVATAKLIAEGAIGRLRLVRAAFSWECDDPDDIRLDPAFDGGALTDVGCYCVNAVRLLAGEPESVLARRAIGPTGVDVSFSGQIGCRDGVLATFDCGIHLPYRAQLEVVGEQGRIEVSDPWVCREPAVRVFDRANSMRQVPVAFVDSYRLELEAFAAAVAGEPSPLLGRADAVGQAQTLAALIRSAEDGGEQPV